MKHLLLLVVGLAGCCHFGAAQAITVTLTGGDTVRQGAMLRLAVSFENVSAKGFELPDMVGLTVVGGPSRQTQVSIVNGQRSSSAAFVYTVVADQPGLGYIPSIARNQGKEQIKSEPVTFFVTEDPNYEPPPMQDVEQANPDARRQSKPRRPTVKM